MSGAAISGETLDRSVAPVAARLGAVLSLAVVVLAGVAVALAGAANDHGYLVPALVRARAAWISGPLTGLALPTPLQRVFAEVALMTAGYAAAVALAPRARLWWIVAAVVGLHVVFLLAPPLLSTDVFSYAAVARLGAHYGLDPYTAAPAAEPHDALYAFLHWRHSVTDYGPLFTLAARPLGRLRPVETVWAFKVVAACAGLGCTGLIGWIAHRTGRSPGRAVAAFGLNPVVLIWTVGGGHNDLLMLAVLLAGVALGVAGRPVRAGMALAGAAAIKLSAGLAIPFLLLGAAHPPRARLRLLAGVLVGAAAIAVLAYTAFPDHALGMVGALERQQALVSISSVPLGIAYALGLPGVSAAEVQVLHVLLAAWLVGCGVWAARGGDVLCAIGWALLGLLVASTWLLPWYTAWPLAFAAAAGSRRLLVATCAVALAYAVGHVPVA